MGTGVTRGGHGEEDTTPAVRRYIDLPEETRKFLDELRGDDIARIRKSMKFSQDMETIGRYGKWLVMGLVAVFMTAVTLGDSIIKAWGWLHGKS